MASYLSLLLSPHKTAVRELFQGAPITDGKIRVTGEREATFEMLDNDTILLPGNNKWERQRYQIEAP